MRGEKGKKHLAPGAVSERIRVGVDAPDPEADFARMTFMLLGKEIIGVTPDVIGRDVPADQGAIRLPA